MLDSGGDFRRFRYEMSLDEYPAVDLEIYQTIRREYLRLVDERRKRG